MRTSVIGAVLGTGHLLTTYVADGPDGPDDTDGTAGAAGQQCSAAESRSA